MMNLEEVDEVENEDAQDKDEYSSTSKTYL